MGCSRSSTLRSSSSSVIRGARRFTRVAWWLADRAMTAVGRPWRSAMRFLATIGLLWLPIVGLWKQRLETPGTLTIWATCSTWLSIERTRP